MYVLLVEGADLHGSTAGGANNCSLHSLQLRAKLNSCYYKGIFLAGKAVSSFGIPSHCIYRRCCKKKKEKLTQSHWLNVQVQEVSHFPDIEVEVVRSFPDLDVKVVNHFPDNCGEWQMVEHFPDFTVRFVQSFPDIKIRYVTSFPGLYHR